MTDNISLTPPIRIQAPERERVTLYTRDRMSEPMRGGSQGWSLDVMLHDGRVLELHVGLATVRQFASVAQQVDGELGAKPDAGTLRLDLMGLAETLRHKQHEDLAFAQVAGLPLAPVYEGRSAAFEEAAAGVSKLIERIA